jgi:hypothetical protein
MCFVAGRREIGVEIESGRCPNINQLLMTMFLESSWSPPLTMQGNFI